MRAVLLEQLPALTRFYGLKPWDLDRMKLREVSEYLTQLQQYQAEAEEEARRGSQ